MRHTYTLLDRDYINLLTRRILLGERDVLIQIGFQEGHPHLPVLLFELMGDAEVTFYRPVLVDRVRGARLKARGELENLGFGVECILGDPHPKAIPY